MANNKKNNLWLTFMLKDTLYAINIEYVTAILKKPEDITLIPRSAPFVKGLINVGGNLITLLGLRELFEQCSLHDELNEFKQMLQDRKIDHINWVNALKDSVKNNTEFTLATDPHKCKFGQWYYEYKSNSSIINMQLKKIEEPHRILHETAAEIKRIDNSLNGNRSNEIDMLLRGASEQLVPRILKLIDDVAYAFEEAHKEIVVVLRYDNEENYAIVFDEVIKIEVLDILSENADDLMCENEYIEGIAKSPDSDELILTIDVPAIITKSRDKIDLSGSLSGDD